MSARPPPINSKSITELLPAFSVAALILVSIFNIGYFSNIGLHFLGLIDLTNIVYSVGLVFGGLIVFVNLFIVAIDVLLLATTSGAKSEQIKYWARNGLIATIAFATGLAILAANLKWQFFTLPVYFAFSTSAVTLWIATRIALRYQTTGTFNVREVTLGLFILATTDATIGKAVADVQITQPAQLYTFLTKSGGVTAVNLVRSSSSGYIVARDGKISFLSKDEVKSIQSEKNYSPLSK